MPVKAPVFLALLAAMLAPVAQSAPAPGTRATLAILETTDLHANVQGYDYFKLAADPSVGIERTATLIAEARKQFANTILLDNGDTIQGNTQADYQATAAPIGCDQVLAIYKAMNRLGYDGAALGNHDFDFGLDFLSQVTGSQFDVAGVPAKRARCAGPNFPLVLANVLSMKTGKPLFAPYRIIDKQVSARQPDGSMVTTNIKVGMIGLVPPIIMSWSKLQLEGKVIAVGVRETAERYVPEMKAKGADIIVAVLHGGLNGEPYSPTMENAGYYLAQVPGIDAMLMGHMHQNFPSAASTEPNFALPGVDKVRGTVHGVPAVMAAMWGRSLGVIALALDHDGKGWRVDRTATQVEVRSTRNADKSYVAADPAFAPLVATEHAATIAYVKTPVGRSDFRMSSYFAEVGDMSALSVVNAAQADYVRNYVRANLPQYATLPVLAMAAPFKNGNAGINDYTDVAAGSLAINSAADLYLFANTINAVKLNGAGLKAWLERAAWRFNTIDPDKTTEQDLLNPSMPGFDFDMITTSDFSYEIDVTQPIGNRITNMRYLGKPVDPAMEFLIATNSYRAGGGGNFPGVNGSSTVIASPDANRDAMIAYIRKLGNITRAAMAKERSWTFKKVATKGAVLYRSAPGKLELAKAAGLDNVSLLRADDGQGKGFALYAVDLSR
jgi:2',3'-cyclic-nucleotide 2'-phosphodiesterase/3'-nucleotidase